MIPVSEEIQVKSSGKRIIQTFTWYQWLKMPILHHVTGFLISHHIYSQLLSIEDSACWQLPSTEESTLWQFLSTEDSTWWQLLSTEDSIMLIIAITEKNTYVDNFYLLKIVHMLTTLIKNIAFIREIIQLLYIWISCLYEEQHRCGYFLSRSILITMGFPAISEHLLTLYRR